MINRIAIRDGTLPPGKTAEHLRELGLSAIEIQLDAGIKPAPIDGIEVSAILLMTDFANDQADWVVRAIEFAESLGAGVVRIDPLTARKDLTGDQIAANCISNIQAILHRTAKSKVRIGLENHAHVANDESFLDWVLSAIPDPRFGLTLDTGNFYWFGYPIEDVYRLVEKYAPRTAHTHIKSINYPLEIRSNRREIGFEYKQYCCGLAQGDLDLARIVRIFKSHQYAGDFCIENESLFKLDDAQKMPALLSDVNALRAAMR